MIDESKVNLDEEISSNLPVPNLPISVPGIGLNTSPQTSLYPDSMPNWMTQDNPLGQSIITNSKPVVDVLQESKGKPGWWKTAAHNFAEYNIEIQAGSFALGAIEHANPLKEETPDDWTPFTPESLQDFPMEYWPSLVDAKGPKDLEARQNALREQMAQDEYYSQGPLSAKIAGGLLGGAASPTSLSILKLASTAKYATISQNVLMNVARSTPGIALESLTRNSLIQANREGGNLEDVAQNTLVDTVFGVGLVGVGAGASAAFRNANLWNSKRLMSMSLDGINAKPVVDENGILTGEYKATPMPGFNLSAAEVNIAQTYLDEQMAKGGILSIPYIGEGIKKMLSIPGLQSPALYAMRSNYAATKSFFNRLVGSPFITAKEQAGVAVPDSALQIADAYSAQALNFSVGFRKKFYEANGIEGNDAAIALKNIKQIITKERQIDMEGFGKEVRRVMYEEGYQSPWRQAHEVADDTHSILTQMNEMYSKLTGKPMFKDPRTAWRYLPQNDNIPMMIAREDEWHKITSDELLRQDNRILDLTQPINDTKGRIDALISQRELLSSIDANHPNIRALSRKISSEKALQIKQNDELVKTVIDSDNDHILLMDRVLLNSSERNQLRTLLEPITTLEDIKSSLDKKLKTARAKKDEKLISEIEKEIEGSNKKLSQLREELNDKAIKGEIDNKFYEMDGIEARFHNPDAPIKFREVYANDEARLNQSRQWYEAKMNMTPQDIIQSILGDLTGDRGMPSYFKQRSVMIPSQVYNEAGFLDPDIAKTITAYMQSIGKVFGFKQAFPEYAVGHDFSGVIKAFSQEHEIRKSAILKEKVSKERDKKLLKLNKEFKEDSEFMENIYKLYMGRFTSDSNPKLAKTVGVMKNLVAGLKLGAVPVYQLSDAAGIIMKQGLMPFLALGLKPLITTLNGHLSGPESEAFIENASHAYIGLNTAQNGYAQKFFNSMGMSEPPVGGAMGGALEKISIGSKNFSHWSGNFFGINQIANLNERISAGAFQSEVMRAAFAFKEGTITAAQKTKMAKYGIQIEDWADRFINSYKQAEGWQVAKGYQSLYYKWNDHEAVARMSMSIRRAVHDSVVNGNIFQNPLWTNSPLGSMVFMFHSWAYNAFNRYTVPLLQRGDSEHILGAMMLVGMSMMSEPLLRLANGKEAFEDDNQWYNSALKGMEYSGLLGPTWEVLANINKAAGNPIFPSLATERSKGYNKYGAFAGPVLGMITDIFDVSGHAIKGDITQGDARKLAHMTPLLSSLALRGAANKFIESSGLPATRRGAEPWMWRQSIYGDEK